MDEAEAADIFYEYGDMDYHELDTINIHIGVQYGRNSFAMFDGQCLNSCISY